VDNQLKQDITEDAEGDSHETTELAQVFECQSADALNKKWQRVRRHRKQEKWNFLEEALDEF
jgi:hypothetical protein